MRHIPSVSHRPNRSEKSGASINQYSLLELIQLLKWMFLMVI